MNIETEEGQKPNLGDLLDQYFTNKDQETDVFVSEIVNLAKISKLSFFQEYFQLIDTKYPHKPLEMQLLPIELVLDYYSENLDLIDFWMQIRLKILEYIKIFYEQEKNFGNHELLMLIIAYFQIDSTNLGMEEDSLNISILFINDFYNHYDDLKQNNPQFFEEIILLIYNILSNLVNQNNLKIENRLKVFNLLNNSYKIIDRFKTSPIYCLSLIKGCETILQVDTNDEIIIEVEKFLKYYCTDNYKCIVKNAQLLFSMTIKYVKQATSTFPFTVWAEIAKSEQSCKKSSHLILGALNHFIQPIFDRFLTLTLQDYNFIHKIINCLKEFSKVEPNDLYQRVKRIYEKNIDHPKQNYRVASLLIVKSLVYEIDLSICGEFLYEVMAKACKIAMMTGNDIDTKLPILAVDLIYQCISSHPELITSKEDFLALFSRVEAFCDSASIYLRNSSISLMDILVHTQFAQGNYLKFFEIIKRVINVSDNTSDKEIERKIFILVAKIYFTLAIKSTGKEYEEIISYTIDKLSNENSIYFSLFFHSLYYFLINGDPQINDFAKKIFDITISNSEKFKLDSLAIINELFKLCPNNIFQDVEIQQYLASDPENEKSNIEQQNNVTKPQENEKDKLAEELNKTIDAPKTGENAETEKEIVEENKIEEKIPEENNSIKKVVDFISSAIRSDDNELIKAGCTALSSFIDIFYHEKLAMFESSLKIDQEMNDDDLIRIFIIIKAKLALMQNDDAKFIGLMNEIDRLSMEDDDKQLNEFDIDLFDLSIAFASLNHDCRNRGKSIALATFELQMSNRSVFAESMKLLRRNIKNSVFLNPESVISLDFNNECIVNIVCQFIQQLLINFPHLKPALARKTQIIRYLRIGKQSASLKNICESFIESIYK